MRKKLTIEFAGMPKSGKSTNIESITSYFQHYLNYKIRKIEEGARISPLDKKNPFTYNSWSFHTTINELLRALLIEIDYDLILIDRGVYDHICFTEALKRDKRITEREAKTSIEYFKNFLKYENAIILFLVEPEEALRRELKHNRVKGRVMNEEFLSILYDVYENYPRLNMDVYVVDGSLPFEKNNSDIIKWIRRYKK